MNHEFEKIMAEGDPVDLDVLTKQNTIIRLKSNVHTVCSNSEILVTAPIYEGRRYPVETGSMLMVSISKETAGLYTFYATVITRKEVDNMSVILLRKGSDVKKSQRRKYFRLPYIGEIKVKDPDQPEETEADRIKRERLKEKFKNNPNIIIEDEVEQKYINMTGKDLSGGGFKALSRKPVEEKLKIEGTLQLDDLIIDFRGSVVRCKRTLDSFENYTLSVKFEGMDDQVRSQIISYIFKKQRSMRKKGLI